MLVEVTLLHCFVLFCHCWFVLAESMAGNMELAREAVRALMVQKMLQSKSVRRHKCVLHYCRDPVGVIMYSQQVLCDAVVIPRYCVLLS